MARSLTIGQAANFNSALSQYLSNTALSATPNSGSVGFWVKFASIIANSYCFSLGNSSNDRVACNINSGNLRLALVRGGSAFAIIDSTALSVGTWYYFAAAWNASGATWYRNGISIGTPFVGNAVLTLAANPRYSIGAETDTSPGGYLNGLMDAVVLFSGALSSGDVVKLYAGGVGVPAVSVSSLNLSVSAIAGYDFGQSGLLVDSIGSNTLTNNNGVTQSSSGIVPAVRTSLASGRALATNRTLAIGQAANFKSALSQSLSVASNSTLQIGAFDWWIGGWAFLNSGSANNATIVSKSGGNGSNREFVLRFNPASTLTFLVNSAASTLVVNMGVSGFTLDSWHFFFAFYNSVTNTASVSVDNGTPTVSSALANPPWTSTNPFNVSSEGGVNGAIDGKADSLFFGKNLPGGFATTPAATIATALYLAGVGLAAKSLTPAQITAWGVVSGWDFDQNNLLTDSIGTNTLTNNGSVTQVPGIVPAVRTLLA